jgi:hypothetical protein
VAQTLAYYHGVPNPYRNDEEEEFCDPGAKIVYTIARFVEDSPEVENLEDGPIKRLLLARTFFTMAGNWALASIEVAQTETEGFNKRRKRYEEIFPD